MAAALLLAAGVCAAGTAARAAETWATLQGDELAAAVSGRHMRLLSDGAVTQQFDAGGSFRAEWRDLAGGPRTGCRPTATGAAPAMRGPRTGGGCGPAALTGCGSGAMTISEARR
jgi:hypothetical protein